MAYGGGVTHSYRGKNSLFRMYSYVRDELFGKGFFGLIAFASEGLEKVYDKNNFIKLREMYRITRSHNRCNDVLLWYECPYELFVNLREHFLLRKKYHFCWNEESLGFMYKDVFTSGKVLYCEFGGKTYYAVCSFKDGELIIRETDFDIENIDILFFSIGEYFGSDNICLYSDEPIEENNCKQFYYGHCIISDDFPYHNDIKNTYINLIAD